MNAIKNHKWSFSTIGGVKRVNLETGSDLLALNNLDQKLWTALSCPIEGLEVDPKTLALIDTDQDGNIRVPEVLAAVNWMLSLLKNPDDLLKQSETLSLDALNESDEAKNLVLSAKLILKNIGKPDANEISIADTANLENIFANTIFNGDGIITVSAANSDSLKDLVQTVINLAGSTQDRSGQDGIGSAQIDAFYSALIRYQNWQLQAKENASSILPLGDQTGSAFQAYQAIKSKIEDYFLRYKLASFNQDSLTALNLNQSRVEEISASNLVGKLDEISSYPLSKIGFEPKLNLKDNINPAWETIASEFLKKTVDLIFPNKTEISLQDWEHVISLFEPYEIWLAVKQGEMVESLSLEQVSFAMLPETRIVLESLIEKDLEMAAEANGMIQVDKLLRFYKDLFQLLRNFVTFFDFYSPNHKAIFQAGTLYIDQRSCDLCIRVNDMDRHNAMAYLSSIYLLYCDCISKSTGETLTIAVALTNGDIDNLMEGRKAIFYDRKGNDFDVTVVKIIENPISIRQAFFTPYRRAAKFIETQVNKFATEQERKLEQQTSSGVTDSFEKIKEKSGSNETQPIEGNIASKPFDIGKFVGIFAALALALGAIGALLASLVGGFLALTWWKMPLAFSAILLIISGPSMIIAWLKLRKRNLAPLLDANGWAINTRTTVNIPFGKTLTQLAVLPKNSSINYNDPFKKKAAPIWLRFLIGFIIGVIIYQALKYYGIFF
jgi:hypothetical protein